jgi:DNA-binding NtrC family response regulator
MAKILIVDDEVSLLEIMADTFVEFGYDVVVAKDGEEAKEVLEKESDSIDLVLSDIHMPRCNGIALLKHSKENFPHIPFSIMTGFSDYKIEDLQKMGVEKIFLKPLKINKLKDFLDKKFAA